MSPPFEAALRQELRAAAVRDLARSARRRRWRLGAIASATAASIVAALGLGLGSPAAADVEVTIRDGRVEVRIVDVAATPGDVQDALRDEGLPVDVEGVPVGPSMVGRLVEVRLADPAFSPIETHGADGYSFDGFSIPEGWPGRLRIAVGEPADPGEAYVAGSDAFAPGEPLDCAPIRGRPLRDAGPALVDLDVLVLPIGRDGAPFALGAPEAEEFAGWFVADGRALSATRMLLRVMESPPPDVVDYRC